MSDENNEVENNTNKLNFNRGRTADNSTNNGLEGLPAGGLNELNAQEANISSSHADTVAEVSERLQEEVVGTDAAPETVLKEAPAAVAVEVAAAAASEQSAKTLASASQGSSDGEDGRSIEELRNEQDTLNRQIAERQGAEKQAVIDQVKNVITTYNISVSELVEGLGGMGKKTRVGTKAKMKYRNPDDGAEWSGRGRSPLWIKDKNKEDFLIS